MELSRNGGSQKPWVSIPKWSKLDDLGVPHDFGNLQVRHTRVLISRQSAASRIDQHCQLKRAKLGGCLTAFVFHFCNSVTLTAPVGGTCNLNQAIQYDPVSWRQCLKSVLCCHAHGFALTSAGQPVSTRHQPRHDGCPQVHRDLNAKNFMITGDDRR